MADRIISFFFLFAFFGLQSGISIGIGSSNQGESEKESEGETKRKGEMNLSSKSFHLRWNNHLLNLRTLLEYMYNEQSFVDVTLSCKDGLIRAHKLVLSACSPYFDSIFRENPCEHPVVILRGISLREIQLIIEYMYVGSVDIPEDELTKLLEVANELHVKGLVQDPVYEDEAPTTTTTATSATTATEKSEESGSGAGSTTLSDDVKMEEESEVKVS